MSEDTRTLREVPVAYTFRGVFKVRASSDREAEQLVRDHCSVCGPVPHSSLPDGDVGWDIDVHASVVRAGR